VNAAACTSSPPAGLIDLIGLLLTALALVVTYKLTRPPPMAPATELPAATCDLQRETCRLALANGQALALRIPERPVRPNQPFVIEARSEGGSLLPLEVSIHGLEVEMSSPGKAFASDGNGGYRAETTLPVCTVNRMRWEVRVVLEANGEHLRWPLLFATESG